MKARAVATIMVFVVCGVAPACGSKPDSKSQVNAALAGSVKELRESLLEEWGVTVPGLAPAAVWGEKNADAVSAVASGAADPPGSNPLDARDRFHVGSITKTFTAALIMQLDQEDALSLDDPVSRWIAYPNGDKITVAMLLGHTSGLADFTDKPAYTSNDSPERLITLAAELDPLFAPGTSWSYSNTNFILLGLIAEQATGSTWQAQVETRFLRPLNLTDTYVWSGSPRPPTVTGSRLACGATGEVPCSPPRSGLAVLPVTDGFDWTIAWAAGALVSTPADVARWTRALVQGDILDREHRALMLNATHPSVDVLAAAPATVTRHDNLRWTGYGLGLFRYEIAGLGVGWGHEGAINGFTANVVHLIGPDLTVAVASNFAMTDTFRALGELASAVASTAPKASNR